MTRQPRVEVGTVDADIVPTGTDFDIDRGLGLRDTTALRLRVHGAAPEFPSRVLAGLGAAEDYVVCRNVDIWAGRESSLIMVQIPPISLMSKVDPILWTGKRRN